MLTNAQNVGIGTNNPHASAELEVNSSSKGLLAPRMSMTERNGIASPAKGLLVFVNDDSSFYYYSGNNWQKMTAAAENWLLSGNASATGKFLGTTDSAALRIKTKNKERITIDSAGHIGLNERNPVYGMHMVDDGSGITDLFIEYNRDDNFVPSVLLGRSIGSYENKLGVDSGTTLGQLSFLGYSKSNSFAGYYPATSIYAVSRDTFSFPAYKADLLFSTGERTAEPGSGKSGNMALTHKGYLGVGTFLPDYTLDVRSRGKDEAPLFQLGNLDNSHRMFLFGGRENDPNPFIQVKASDPLRFATDQNGFTETMRINPDGFVGIGVTNPLDKLHVGGNIRVQDDANIFGLDLLVGFNDLRLAGDALGDPDIVIGATGRVGIGANPLENVPLYLKGKTGAYFLSIFADDAGTSRFEVSNAGRTGFNGAYSNVTFNIRAAAENERVFMVENPAANALLFSVEANGDVHVDGNLSKAGGSFKIDHPTDPENKYLYHSFVESPDMMNVYNGNIITNDAGEAIINMPEWFEALNRDFRYQLTVIGEFAQAIVSSKMKENSFSIKTDKPNVEVSWQVTGIRKDAWANSHRIPVEEDKDADNKGKYLHPNAFGKNSSQQAGRQKMENSVLPVQE